MADKMQGRYVPTYVSDDKLVDGDEILGIMFDRTKRFWLVLREEKEVL